MTARRTLGPAAPRICRLIRICGVPRIVGAAATSTLRPACLRRLAGPGHGSWRTRFGTGASPSVAWLLPIRWAAPTPSGCSFGREVRQRVGSAAERFAYAYERRFRGVSLVHEFSQCRNGDTTAVARRILANRPQDSFVDARL